MALAYILGAELPDRSFDWRDSANALIDFSGGWTFTLKVTDLAKTTQFTKTTTITGSATSPNVTIAWATSGELGDLTAGEYTGWLTARRTSDSKDRTFQFPISLEAGPS